MKINKILIILPLTLMMFCKKEAALVSVETILSVREAPNKNSRVIKELYNNE